MSLKERVYSVLVVSCADSFNNSLLSLLPPSNFNPVITAGSIAEAKRITADKSYDLIIINSPLPDENGFRFAIDCCQTKGSVVMLLVKSEIYTETQDKLGEHGVFTMAKPTTKQAISQALCWMESSRERLRSFEKKNTSVEERMEEIRLINRAKWLLITELKMTEPDAHRYIEKSAMDSCAPKSEIARKIISTYS